MEEDKQHEKNIDEKDYYELLEISRGASSEVIKNAYRALAKKYHPDTNNLNDEEVQEKIRQINIAYEVLSDPEKKSQYDIELQEKENNEDYNLQEKDENFYEDEEKMNPNKKKFIIIFIVVIAFIFITLLTFLIVSFVSDPPVLKKNSLDEKNTTVDVKESKEENKNDNKDYNKDDNKIVNDYENKLTETSEESIDIDDNLNIEEEIDNSNIVKPDIEENVDSTNKDTNKIVESDDGIITIY